MSWLGFFWSSMVGKKVVMALSGIILFGFVLFHMLGNLKLYLGPQALNGYSVWLRVAGEPLFPSSVALWIVRVILIAAVVAHMWAAWQVSRGSWAARPRKYTKMVGVQLDYADRTMRWGGVIIGSFVLFHVLHLTTGSLDMGFVRGDVYHNVVSGFSIWWVSAVYIAANLFLGLHLYHGLWSMFQSLGLAHPVYNQWRKYFAVAFAVVITAGNVSFPLSVLSGLVRLGGR